MEKRYYWLKLKEDFFDEDVINWLEDQENGKEYCLFYLKLCLKSLKTDGILIRSVGDFLIPYDTKKLAEITRTDIDTVRVAMETLKNIGLLQILDNGEIYVTQLEKMVGSESANANAQRQKRFREKQKQLKLGVTNSVTNNNVEKEYRERDKEIDIDKKKNIKEKYFDNETINNLFIDFLDLRIKLKAKNTEQAIKLLLNKLNKYDDDTKIQMIEQSIMNSWKSVFEVKAKKQTQSERLDEWIKEAEEEERRNGKK